MIPHIIIARTEALFQLSLDELLRFYKVTKRNVYVFGKDTPQPPIEEMRRIKLLATSSFSQPTVFVIWHLDAATELTQNTLVKILEEHPAQLLFVFWAMTETGIIPTIASRARILRNSASTPPSIQKADVWDALTAPTTRSPLASSLLKLENKKEADIVPAIDDFLRYGYQKLHNQKKDVRLLSSLERALSALRLIREQNMDPELALNSIFIYCNLT